MESHAEIKDTYQELDLQIDEIANVIRSLDYDHTLTDRYNEIDQEIYELALWYDEKKKMLETYEREKEHMQIKAERIAQNLKKLNNHVQNLKLRTFSKRHLTINVQEMYR